MLLNTFTSQKTQQNTKIDSSSTTQGASISSTPSPSPTPTYKPADYSFFDQFIYPGSKISQKSPTSLTLESSDNPDNITGWYKDKIKSLNLNTQTFVVTRNNDNVLNKLAGADSEKRINVEIKKEPGSDKTQISVNLKGF